MAAKQWPLGQLILMMLVLISLASSLAYSDEQVKLQTSDDLSIVGAYYSAKTQQPSQRLIIVSPGYAQHADTKSMQHVAQGLTEFGHVVVISYRGNGNSAGKYTFGAKEFLDLQAVYHWAQSKFNTITVLGFSLGAYTALRFCAQQSPNLDQLLLVSCPPSMEAVFFSGAAFLNPLIILFRKSDYAIQPDLDIWFRWGWPFQAKPNLLTIVGQVTVPTHFLIGANDTLVYPNLTRKVAAAMTCERSVTTMPNGLHAEHMFLQEPEKFLAWVKEKLVGSSNEDN